MKTTALALALVLLAPLSLSAAPLRGTFLLAGDSFERSSSAVSIAKGRASIISDNFRVSAAEITFDQSNLTQSHVSVMTCRGVTSVSAGYSIPASKELQLEIDGQSNIYLLNPAGIIVQDTATVSLGEKPFHGSVFTLPKNDPAPTVPASAATPIASLSPSFSEALPKLELSLRPISTTRSP